MFKVKTKSGYERVIHSCCCKTQARSIRGAGKAHWCEGNARYYKDGKGYCWRHKPEDAIDGKATMIEETVEVTQ